MKASKLIRKDSSKLTKPDNSKKNLKTEGDGIQKARRDMNTHNEITIKAKTVAELFRTAIELMRSGKAKEINGAEWSRERGCTANVVLNG